MRRKLVLIIAALALLVTACSSDDGSNRAEEGPLTVWAPQTLKRAMPDVEAAFEEQHGDIPVEVTVTESAIIEQRLASGERPDVLIETKDAMDAVVSEDSSLEPALVGDDAMAIVVIRDNPAGVEDLTVFGDSPVRTAVCEEATPCGQGASAVLDQAGIVADPDKVLDGWLPVADAIVNDDVDAGLLYRTEYITKLRRISVVPLPAGITQVVEYYAAAMTDDGDADTFVDWLADSEEASAVLKTRGLRALVEAPDEAEGDQATEG